MLVKARARSSRAGRLASVLLASVKTGIASTDFLADDKASI
ncbi:hypothetical protein BN2476_320315 [Paraburkholderia piptadeniae]|uniref:Uncharacterized protein n=1 Tax=Paraburkholderia piptadeniae TaxID=1701573 RepID=A0A1N7S606_9BURK|nr:hypothetical protein BN2476_320315 [Paraburkholderia piptadeniae]